MRKFWLGKYNGLNVYMPEASWDCGWYWGFGYIQNKDIHFHFDRVINDCLSAGNITKAYRDTFVGTKLSDKDIWELFELMRTFYTLRETAEVLGRGGSHISRNRVMEDVKNPEEVERINKVVLPKLFEQVYEILERSR